MSIPQPVHFSLDSWRAIQNTPHHNGDIYNPDNYQQLLAAIEKRWQTPHGDSQRWQQALDALPPNNHNIKLQYGDTIKITWQDNQQQSSHFSSNKFTTDELKKHLFTLSPWRKGPFQVFDVCIDAEWQSNWKWQRLKNSNLDKLFERADVLDIGCGNGYYGWRMLEAGATSILGIDGSMLLHYQFAVCKKYAPLSPLMLFPIRFDLLPNNIKNFDVVSSMGVLSHNKDPIEHLQACKERLKRNGTLLLETLIIDTTENTVLEPQGRYAKMNNVFALPSPCALQTWLQQVGFTNVEIHNINRTTPQEQRATEWMGNQSLEHFLDAQDHSKTIEGYPAPTRLLLTAKK